MSYRGKFILLSFISCWLFFNAPLLGKTYTRNELLDEGRGSINTLGRYKKMSSKDYVSRLVFRFTTFNGYQVYTQNGEDTTDVTFANFDGKLAFQKIPLTLYFIGDFYSFQSRHRNMINTEKEDGVLVPSRDSDNQIEYENIDYGSLIELYTGFDYTLFNLFLINIGAKLSGENLNNCDYDTRDIQGISQNADGINIDSEGNLIYQEIEETKTRTVKPIFGVAYLENFKSTISYSSDLSGIDATESFLRYRLSKTIGFLGGSHTFYKYWDNENGLAFNWEKILGFLDTGSEFLVKTQKISNMYINMESPKIPFYTASTMKLGLKLNAVQTPDTLEDMESNEFLFGGKIDLSLFQTVYKGVDMYVNGHLQYNDYDTLRVFGSSKNKLGGGFEAGYFF